MTETDCFFISLLQIAAFYTFKRFSESRTAFIQVEVSGFMPVTVYEYMYPCGSWSRSQTWGRADGTLIILLVSASVYKRPQTAAAPTLSSPCSKHRSANKRRPTWFTNALSKIEHVWNRAGIILVCALAEKQKAGFDSPLLSAVVWAPAVQTSASLCLLWSGLSSALACPYGRLAPLGQTQSICDLWKKILDMPHSFTEC